jgi:hypothetical protein
MKIPGVDQVTHGQEMGIRMRKDLVLELSPATNAAQLHDVNQPRLKKKIFQGI